MRYACMLSIYEYQLMALFHRLGWRSKALANPSIHSHLTDPSLLPATPSTTPDRSYITAYAPASGHFIRTIPSATKLEIEQAITRADMAQYRWRESSFADRRKVMRSLLKWCVDDMEAIARVASRDTGKTREFISCSCPCVLLLSVRRID